MYKLRRREKQFEQNSPPPIVFITAIQNRVTNSFEVVHSTGQQQKKMLRLFCLFVLAFVAIVSKTGACRHSAARHPGAFISNDVESLPELFAVKHPKFSRAFCPKAKPNR